jgi:hypothetical protein
MNHLKTWTLIAPLWLPYILVTVRRKGLVNLHFVCTTVDNLQTPEVPFIILLYTIQTEAFRLEQANLSVYTTHLYSNIASIR